MRCPWLAEAEQITRNLALALEEHTGKAFLSVDQLLTGIAEALVIRIAETARPWNSEDIVALLRRRLVHTPHIRAILFLDADGLLRIDSDGGPPNPLDLSDRNYFKVHRNDPDYGLFIGGTL